MADQINQDDRKKIKDSGKTEIIPLYRGAWRPGTRP